MPRKKSAMKELHKSKKRNAVNQERKYLVRKEEKKVKALVAEKKTSELVSELKNYCKTIDQAAANKIIHKNKAARKKSQLMKMINRLSQSAA